MGRSAHGEAGGFLSGLRGGARWQELAEGVLGGCLQFFFCSGRCWWSLEPPFAGEVMAYDDLGVLEGGLTVFADEDDFPLMEALEVSYHPVDIHVLVLELAWPTSEAA